MHDKVDQHLSAGWCFAIFAIIFVPLIIIGIVVNVRNHQSNKRNEKQVAEIRKEENIKRGKNLAKYHNVTRSYQPYSAPATKWQKESSGKSYASFDSYEIEDKPRDYLIKDIKPVRGIYYLKNNINDEIIYIGKTNNLQARISDHLALKSELQNKLKNIELSYDAIPFDSPKDNKFFINEWEAEQIKNNRPRFNVLRKVPGHSTNGGIFVSYDGRGKEFKPKSWQELKGHKIAITGMFGKYDRYEVINAFREKGLIISPYRKTDVTSVWFIGKDRTIGLTKFKAIKPNDLVVREETVLRLMKEL